jgi:predicted HicB family RNase H-like nuclease
MNIDTYQYQVFFSEEDQGFISTVAEFPYLSADGATHESAISELRAVVADAVEVLVSEGKEPPLPLSEREFRGNISLRLSSDIHRLVVTRAREEGCSLNQFLTSLIERNIYADKIEAVVKMLDRVSADLEVGTRRVIT